MINIEDYKDIFEPFEKLVSLEVEGEPRAVPENNSLLRCFQYLNLEAISMGDFCWNGNCANCQVWIETDEGEKPVLTCRTNVKDGMKITRMNEAIQL